jgi:predicted regulator of Ras-like GTPase activity (Roadblock/LC7/MglB family)
MENTDQGLGSLVNVLKKMRQEGNFNFCVLIDKDGFQVASSANDHLDLDRKAATIALIQRTIHQVQRHMQMTSPQEVVIFDSSGQRLVCRLFQIQQYPMILACIVPDRNQPYRQIINKAIREIRQNWKL